MKKVTWEEARNCLIKDFKEIKTEKDFLLYLTKVTVAFTELMEEWGLSQLAKNFN